MRRNIGPLVADVFPPERNKFRAPIVMVHGLWVGGWCWHEWATRLCNLGWECWSLDLKERAGGPPQAPEEAADDLRAVLAEAAFPPVLMGHGSGARLALAAAAGREVTAAVLVAPDISPYLDDLPRPMRLLRLRYLALLLMRRPILIRPADFLDLWLGGVPAYQQREIVAALAPEPAPMVRALFERGAALPEARFPALVLGGARDRAVPGPAVGGFARDIGAAYLEAEDGGHWLLEDGDLVGQTHRWLVRTLGEDIQEPSIEEPS